MRKKSLGYSIRLRVSVHLWHRLWGSPHVDSTRWMMMYCRNTVYKFSHFPFLLCTLEITHGFSFRYIGVDPSQANFHVDM